MRRLRWSRAVPYLATLVAFGVVVRDWWRLPAMLAGHSSRLDFQRQFVLDQAIRAGDWWPRFNEVFYHGYGSPLFHFYPPLSYYIAEIPLLLGAPIETAIKAAAAVGLLLSGLFMVALARDLLGDAAACVAGPLYVLAPYHLVDLLVRHALAEGIAFAWLPLTLWGLLGAVRDRSCWRATAAALGLALLLLTHAISALLAAPVLLGWWLVLAMRHRHTGMAGPLLGAAAGLWGALWAGFHWVPAVLEADTVKSVESLTTGNFQFSVHFVTLGQLLWSGWGWGLSVPGKEDGMSFQLGLAHWALLLGVPLAWHARREWRASLTFMVVLTLVSLAMCLPATAPIWATVPKLPFVQFPWRFLQLATFGASLCAGAVVQWAVGRLSGRLASLALLAFVLLPFAAYAPYTEAWFETHRLEGWLRSDGSRCTADGYFARHATARLRPFDADSYATQLRARLRTGTLGDDFLPNQVRAIPAEAHAVPVFADGGEIVRHDRIGPRSYRVVARMSREGVLVLRRFMFPGWTARVDGEPAAVRAFGDEGTVAVDLAPGHHEILIWFGSTPLRTGAALAAVGGVVGWLAVISVGCRRRRLFGSRGRESDRSEAHRRPT
jgi:hypothetical protein